MNKTTLRIISLILAFALVSGNFIHAQATAKANTMQTAAGGMWISSSELMSLPTSGTAWDKLRSVAYGSWGTVNLANQDTKHAINTLAGALVYARTGDTSLRSKVRDAILAAKRTLDQSSEWQTTNGVLAAGRQIGAYAIAADLIGLTSYDAAADNEFRNWLGPIRTTNIGTHGRWKAITFTCENGSANWATFACASRIAASIYLGDTADVERSASIIRAFLGDRSAYPANAPGRNGYFQPSAGYDSSWSCDSAAWQAINPSCVKSGVNIDGVLVDDASRGGGCCVLQGDGIMYSWEALQGLYVSAELLYRTGAYGDPYNWSNRALKRAVDFMQRSGWGISNVSTYVPWLANARYGTSYPTATSITGRIMSWGEWLYRRTSVQPPSVSTPTQTATRIAATSTSVVQPTATSVVPPTATPVVQATATSIVPPTATSVVPPTATSVVPPTATPVVPTTVPIVPTMSSVAAAGTYDNRSNVFSYSGSWGEIMHSGAYDGSFARSRAVDSSVTMTFTGQSVSILYTSNSTFGRMEVFVDGALVGQIDQYSSSRRVQRRWDLPISLSSGVHTLMLVHKGASLASLDAVIVSSSTTSITNPIAAQVQQTDTRPITKASGAAVGVR